jgi:aminopeptidase N
VNSKVRTAALYGLGNLKKDSLMDFFKQRFEIDDSYVVQAGALIAMGKIGDDSSMQFLKQAREMKSPRNVVRVAADWAMKEITER